MRAWISGMMLLNSDVGSDVAGVLGCTCESPFTENTGHSDARANTGRSAAVRYVKNFIVMKWRNRV